MGGCKTKKRGEIMPHGQTQALRLSHATTGPELRLDLGSGLVMMRKAPLRTAVLSSTSRSGDYCSTSGGSDPASQPMTVGVCPES